MADLLQEYRDKINQAIQEEQLDRDISFFTDDEYISGNRVHALTPYLMLKLQLAKSPFVVGGTLTIDDVFAFLWIIKHKDIQTDKVAYYQEILKNCNSEEVIEDIQKYLERTYGDSVGGSEAKEAPYVSGYAHLIDTFAREYGWSEERIMNTPYKRLNQYIRCIIRRNDDKAIMTNRADALKSEYLRKIQGL
jgi:hypothetical protein